DWRTDPAVTAFCFRNASAWSNTGIPATLDGEPIRLPPRARIAFKAVAFKAWAAKPMPEAPEAPDLKDIGV
ncbi:MAG: hypothetical protein ACXW3D_09410, partial [Caulobacteraceae bacterium]